MNSKGVLLINLGSPDSTAVPDVRKYLREFLMDGRVMDVAYPLRWFIVNCMILPRRPAQSAEAYHSIWTKEGSPLIVTTVHTAELLEKRIGRPVAVAMRYQSPTPETALKSLHDRGVKDAVVIPLFPHYAMSSFETAVEYVKETAAKLNLGIELTYAPPYYNRPDYIRALVAKSEPYLKQDFDHLLFSFHGLPIRHLHKADPTHQYCLKAANCCETPSAVHRTCYRAQCFATAHAFAEAAGLPQDKYSVAFQSRLGREPWMQPYTDLELKRLPTSGARKILVICPAFVSDCLETLEEIAMRGKETFMEAGGESFEMIPCLNEHPLWIETLAAMVTERDSRAETANAV